MATGEERVALFWVSWVQIRVSWSTDTLFTAKTLLLECWKIKWLLSHHNVPYNTQRPRSTQARTLILRSVEQVDNPQHASEVFNVRVPGSQLWIREGAAVVQVQPPANQAHLLPLSEDGHHSTCLKWFVPVLRTEFGLFEISLSFSLLNGTVQKLVFGLSFSSPRTGI